MASETITKNDLKGVLDAVIPANSLAVETVPVTATASTGVATALACYRYGKIVQLFVQCQNSSSVAAGSNVFVGTINGAPPPLIWTTAGGYFGAHAIQGAIGTNNAVTIRNASSSAVSISGTSTTSVTFTYITE